MRAGATSVVYERPPPASGMGTMATSPPTLPAPKPRLFPLRRLSLSLPTPATAPLGAHPAAVPAAPSAAAELAIVDGGVAAQSMGSATTDVLGQPALPAAPPPHSAPTPALGPLVLVLAGSAPAPPVAAPLAPPAAAPLMPPETAPLAPPVAAPPAPPVAGLSAPPVAVLLAPPVANPPVPSAQRPPSPGHRQQRPQSPARQDERETSRDPAARPPHLLFLSWLKLPSLLPGNHSLDLRQPRLLLAVPSRDVPALEMVIAGAPEPSPERAAAWSAVVAKPQSPPEKATTASKPPVLPAPKPATTDAEKTLPPVPAAPLGLGEAGPSAPVVAPPAPPDAPVPLAPVVAPTAFAPAGGAADPPVPAPGALVAPAASVPDVPAPASASSPKAASATTVCPAPMVAPPGAHVMAPAPLSAVPQERETSRRRRNSPRRYQQQAQWPAHPGGNGGWRGPHGRGGGGRYRPPVTMADLQREVSRAVREERAAQSQSSSLRAAPAHVAPRQTVPPMDPPPAAAFPPHVLAPSAPSPSVLAPAPGSRLHLPPVPPVAGVEFVVVGGGTAAQHSHHVAADEPLLFLTEALQPPQTCVPEVTLGQLHRLGESLHALLLIQVLAHSSLPVIPPETFRGRQRDTCLDAADQLAALLAPVLAAPAEGGAAGAGELDEAVRGLKRHLRAGSGAAVIGTSTLVVRELWRSLTGVLHALGAHRM
ncbi:unnamed protein product [Closterium sp. Naga37s-1]|nr:unnamed protein product [Closterium sp. Naga37s-1]